MIHDSWFMMQDHLSHEPPKAYRYKVASSSFSMFMSMCYVVETLDFHRRLW